MQNKGSCCCFMKRGAFATDRPPSGPQTADDDRTYRVGSRIILGFAQSCHIHDSADLWQKVRIMLCRGPDHENQMKGIDLADLALPRPALDDRGEGFHLHPHIAFQM